MSLVADPLLRRALIEVVLLGVLGGPLGAWVLVHRDTYAAESFSHALLPGVVVAALVGLPLTLGAAGGVLLAALAIALVARDRGLGPDGAVAVVVTTLLGLGALLALAPANPARLERLLFGDLLAVRTADVAVTAGLTALVLLGLAAGHRRLTLVAFDRVSAPALGARPALVELALLALLAVAVLAAVQALGNLLVLALLIGPAAAARRLGRTLTGTLVLAAVLGAVAGAGGLALSTYADLGGGASVALAALAVFALSLARLPRRRRTPGRPRRSPVEALGAPPGA